jgi:RNA polymerase sigma-70 factor (ECF subfamily)
MTDSPQPDSSRLAQFDELLASAQNALRGFVRGMVGSDEQAQDITQDVFVDAWRATSRGQAPFDGSGDEPAMRRWLFHVAYQRSVSALRRRAVLHVESLDEQIPLEADHLYAPLPFEDRVAESEALQDALNALDPQDTACLLLSAAQGFTAFEISTILQVSPAAAKKRLTRAKQRLRAAYFAKQERETTRTQRGEEQR